MSHVNEILEQDHWGVRGWVDAQQAFYFNTDSFLLCGYVLNDLFRALFRGLNKTHVAAHPWKILTVESSTSTSMVRHLSATGPLASLQPVEIFSLYVSLSFLGQLGCGAKGKSQGPSAIMGSAQCRATQSLDALMGSRAPHHETK